MLRSLALEIVATFMPSAWWGLMMAGIAKLRGGSPVPVKHARRWKLPSVPARKLLSKLRRPKAEPEPVQRPAVKPAVAVDDPLHAFIADCLEEAAGESMTSTELFDLWKSWCAKRSTDPRNQRAFGTKLKARLSREEKNNRIRYLNVRRKQAQPAGPRLVVANG